MCASNHLVHNVSAALSALVLVSCGSVFTTSSEPAGSALGNYYFLPKTRIKIDGTPVKEGSSYSITISQISEPDRDHRYFLLYHRNALAEDTYTVTVDGKGLLQTLNLQAEDKTPAIINKVADTVVSALSAAANVAGLRTAKQPCEPIPAFTVVFDPQDGREYSAAKSALKDDFELEVVPNPESRIKSSQSPNAEKPIVVGARSPSSLELQNRSADGVFFHPPTTVTLKITPKNTCLRLFQVTDIRIPDKHQLSVFDLRRMALVKRTTNLAFVEGNLTTVTETRPSQVLAAVTIPADLAAKAAAAVPTLIKIQNDTANASTNAETARLNAQTARLNAESERLKAEAALARQRAASATSPSSATRAVVQHAEAENAKAQTELLRTRAQLGPQTTAPAPSSNSTATPTPSPANREPSE